MTKTIYVDCPFCEGMLEINTETGKVVQKWAPGEKKQSADDKLSAALKKIDEGKKKRATLFDQTQEVLADQKKKAESSFLKEVERIKKEGVVEKPTNPFDLD